MAYTPDSALEESRLYNAKLVIQTLANLPGTDVLPANFDTFANKVSKKIGLEFLYLGRGRYRVILDIVHPEIDLGLVLKIGNQQSISRDIALSMKFPEDRPKLYAAFGYGLVAERVSTVTGVDDGRLKTPEFAARIAKLNERYIGLLNEDIGFADDRIVVIGSSTRLVNNGRR
jgi:hypothetical protein